MFHCVCRYYALHLPRAMRLLLCLHLHDALSFFTFGFEARAQFLLELDKALKGGNEGSLEWQIQGFTLEWNFRSNRGTLQQPFQEQEIYSNPLADLAPLVFLTTNKQR